jgi:hypothetical protein
VAVVDAYIRGWPGTNDAQRGPLRHFASKGLGVRVLLAPPKPKAPCSCQAIEASRAARSTSDQARPSISPRRSPRTSISTYAAALPPTVNISRSQRFPATPPRMPYPLLAPARAGSFGTWPTPLPTNSALSDRSRLCQCVNQLCRSLTNTNVMLLFSDGGAFGAFAQGFRSSKAKLGDKVNRHASSLKIKRQ